jgi:hypothetical protein
MKVSNIIFLFFILFSVFFKHSFSDDSSDSIFGNVVEGFVKDLFKKEMRTVDNANMTDCMTRLLCEQICRRTSSGQINEPLLDSKEIMGKDPSLPKNLNYFFAGGDRGFEYGQNKQCFRCAHQYKHCNDDQYEYAKELTNSFISSQKFN